MYTNMCFNKIHLHLQCPTATRYQTIANAQHPPTSGYSAEPDHLLQTWKRKLQRALTNKRTRLMETKVVRAKANLPQSQQVINTGTFKTLISAIMRKFRRTETVYMTPYSSNYPHRQNENFRLPSQYILLARILASRLIRKHKHFSAVLRQRHAAPRESTSSAHLWVTVWTCSTDLQPVRTAFIVPSLTFKTPYYYPINYSNKLVTSR